jgi:hypothetical protein
MGGAVSAALAALAADHRQLELAMKDWGWPSRGHVFDAFMASARALSAAKKAAQDTAPPPAEEELFARQAALAGTDSGKWRRKNLAAEAAMYDHLTGGVRQWGIFKD